MGKSSAMTKPEWMHDDDWSVLTPMEQKAAVKLTVEAFIEKYPDSDTAAMVNDASDDASNIAISDDDKPADVKAWVDNAAKHFDAKFREQLVISVDAKITSTHRTLVMCDYILSNKLVSYCPRWDSENKDWTAESNQPAPDVYWIERHSKRDNAPLDPVKGHRLYDLHDKIMPDYTTAVAKFAEMTKADKDAMGEDKFKTESGIAKRNMKFSREYFRTASQIALNFVALNELKGVKVTAWRDKDGGAISKSPFPFVLRDTSEEHGAYTSISAKDLGDYRPDVAEQLLKDGKHKTMYLAVLASKKPRKRKAKTAETKTAGSAQGNDVTVNNINQYESASGEVAHLIDADGFKASWLKRVNDKEGGDDFLLSEYSHWQWLERMFGMNDSELAKRAGKLSDAKATTTNKAAA